MTQDQPRPKFRAWTGGYERPSCIKLSLYLGGLDARTACAAIEFWRDGSLLPSPLTGQVDDGGGEAAAFGQREVSREAALVWAAGVAQASGVEVVLVDDALPDVPS